MSTETNGPTGNLVQKANAAIAAKKANGQQAPHPMVNPQAMTEAQMFARIAELEKSNRELAQVAAERQKALSCKVQEKGTVSVYGLGRMPVTLYRGQWLRLIAFIDTVKAFLRTNDVEITAKEKDYAALSPQQKEALKVAAAEAYQAKRS